jgi:hypothetical protein
MIVHEHRESDIGERLSEAFKSMLFHTGIAVSHGDGRMALEPGCGREQPTAQAVASLNLKFNIAWLDHDALLMRIAAR